MARTRTPGEHGTPAPGSSVTPVDPLQESLDELARVADELVDRLTIDEPAVMAVPPAVPGSPEQLRETLDALDQLADRQTGPQPGIGVEVAGDRGEDIQAHLDSLLESPTAEVEVAVETDLSELAVAALTEPTPEPEPAPVPEPAPAMEAAMPAIRDPEPDELPPVDGHDAEAADPPLFDIEGPGGGLDAVDTLPETPSGGRRGWLVAAAILAIVALGGGLWLLLGSASDEPGTAMATALPAARRPMPPTEPVVPDTPFIVDRTIVVDEPVTVDPLVETDERGLVDEQVVLEEPIAIEPAPVVKSKPKPIAPKPVAPKPVAPPPVAEPEVVNWRPPAPPTRTPAKPERRPEPVSTPDVEAFFGSIVEEQPEPVDVAAVAPTPLPEDELNGVRPAGDTIEPFRPPALVERHEAMYPPRAQKRGAAGTVVLRVLVNEEGRVVRVVVEEGVGSSDLEAAAIDAVLRWRYEPASELGHAVRAWVTESFTFGE